MLWNTSSALIYTNEIAFLGNFFSSKKCGLDIYSLLEGGTFVDGE